MFNSTVQRRDWQGLQDSIEVASVIVPCISYPDAWFPDTQDDTVRHYREAKKLCGSCLVIRECAAYAIKHEDHGLWGGLTPPERDRIAGRPAKRRRN